MLNIKETESKNEVEVVGILKELEVKTGTSKNTGKDYVNLTAKVIVDQEINGKMTENLIPVKMMAMKLKKNGEANPAYQRIVDYGERFTSAAAAEDITKASRVRVTGCKLKENPYLRTDGSLLEKNFTIDGSFISKAGDSDEDQAIFEVSGVVGQLINETDKDGNDSGRLIVNLVVIGYNGVANVIKMVAEGAAKSHIEQNWSTGDTVKASGRINMCANVKVYYEEQGFGAPLEKKKTEFRQELVILGGSSGGLDEAYSYDADDVKMALNDRTARIEEIRSNPKKTSTSTSPAKGRPDFNF